MRLSTRTRYGARAIVELAVAYPRRSLSVREVADSLKLSAKYLEHIMASLKAGGLVRASRGMQGGYALARPPRSITLNDVFQVLEGNDALVQCVVNASDCPVSAHCATRETWVEMQNAITDVLKGTSLQDLVERKRSKAGSAAPMYQI